MLHAPVFRLFNDLPMKVQRFNSRLVHSMVLLFSRLFLPFIFYICFPFGTSVQEQGENGLWKRISSLHVVSWLESLP